MSQRRLIAPLAVATALALSGCGSDDSPTADSAVPLPSSTGAPTAPTATSRPSTTGGADTMPTDRTPGTEPPVSLVLNPDVTRPPVRPSVPGTDATVPVPDEPTNDDVGRAIAHVRLLVDDPDASVELVIAEDVTWPDGSIGCPQPGMVYTQALVEGSRIVVRHDDVEYAYHRGGGRDLFWCPTAILPLSDR